MQHFDSCKHYCFRSILIFSLSFLFLAGYGQVFTVDSIMRNGSRNNRINYAYMSDGYLNAELPLFITNATAINTSLFNTTPFKEYKNYFNSFAIRVPSAEAGAKHPRTAPDEPSPAQPIANPNNYFQSTFDYSGIHRLLYSQNSIAISSVLASNLPDYDQGFVVINSPYYGGSGGQFPAASTDPSSAEVAIHEIGHSFAGLADEYWAGTQYAAEKPNMTTNNNPATIKWKSWLNINAVGIYPYGSNAPLSSWFRPHQTCKMQYLGFAFCSVCTERFIDVIHQRVSMIDNFAPATTSFTLNNTDPTAFAVTPVTTSPNTIHTNWYLNDVLYASNRSNVDISYNEFPAGTNTVKAEVIDSSILSKTYLPGAGYISSTTWTVTKSGTLPVLITSFTGVINNKAGVLKWELENGTEVAGFELSKSKDGTSFLPVTTINSEQNKNQFTYTDPALFSGSTYYRLKVVYKDGSWTYSPVIRLQNAFDNFAYKVYQNAELRRYHLTTTLSNSEKVALQLTDVSGRLLLRKDFGKVSGQLDYNIDLAGKSAGIYFLRISINNSIYTVQLLAK